MSKHFLNTLLFSIFATIQLTFGNLLVNQGFEVSENTYGGWPNTYGDWKGDYSRIVAAENGIEPLEGSRMLKFEGTGNTGADSRYEASDVIQLIDLGAYSHLVQRGNAVLNASACFNRISESDDDAFRIYLRAFEGSPSDFPLLVESLLLANTMVEMNTDNNESSWEELIAELQVPSNATFAAIYVCAVENIQRDGVYPEFLGHYADNISVRLVPEPATLSLLAIGGLLLSKRML